MPAATALAETLELELAYEFAPEDEFGFADLAHMPRHFKKTFGVAPGRWAAITGPAGTRRLDK